MTKVLEARMQRHPGLIFARAACSSLQHNSIVSCPRHRDLHGRSSANLRGKLDRTFAATGEPPRRARTSSASSSSAASWTFAAADEYPPEAHANLRPTSMDPHGEQEPPRQAEAPRRAGPPRQAATSAGSSTFGKSDNIRDKRKPPSHDLRTQNCGTQAEPPRRAPRSSSAS